MQDFIYNGKVDDHVIYACIGQLCRHCFHSDNDVRMTMYEDVCSYYFSAHQVIVSVELYIISVMHVTQQMLKLLLIC